MCNCPTKPPQLFVVRRYVGLGTYLRPGADRVNSVYSWHPDPAIARKFSTPADAISVLATLLGREPRDGEYEAVPYHPSEHGHP